MSDIDVKIAESEAEWRRYRYGDAGVRESAVKLIRALNKSAGKRVNCLCRNVCPSFNRAGFRPTYDESRRNLVVSLTSTAQRIRNILPTLYSLAAQTRKPDLMVLWLGEDGSYPKEIISKIKKTGILIRYREDLGPNTKYHYAFSEYGDDLVITVDDDVIYHKRMIEELYGAYLRHPGAVIARRVHKMRFDRERRPLRYKDWIWEYRDSDAPAFDLFATGTGGVLYPPEVTALKCWEDKAFLTVCPKADDIWLKFSELKNGVRVYAVKDSGYDKDAVTLRTVKTGLAAGNIDRGGNDQYIRSCTEYFGINDDLCERIYSEE